jgi:hypothetical protein
MTELLQTTHEILIHRVTREYLTFYVPRSQCPLFYRFARKLCDASPSCNFQLPTDKARKKNRQGTENCQRTIKSLENVKKR